jgi:Zn ribbon nucleic-acid-binding protein
MNPQPGLAMTPEYRIDAEKRITSYLSSNDIVTIKYMQVEQTFHDLGVEIHVWNVRADGSKWWVVEGEGVPMNLYTQDEFYFSADEAYSFHMGISQRLQARHHKEFKHIIDELPLDIDGVKSISRRLNIAATNLNEISGAEDIQNIGLICRESLIELAAVLVQANPGILEENNLKAADFKGIARTVIAIYARGKRNDTLRKHSRSMSEMAWDYASEVVHSPNRNIPDAKICLLFACTIVSIFQNLYLKYLGFDAEKKCPECKSMDVDFHSSDGEILIMICKECGHEEPINEVNKVDCE